SRHTVAWTGAAAALEKYFWKPVIPMTLTAIGVVFGLGLREGSRIVWLRNSLFILGAAAASLVGILHTGGYPNVLMPVYAAFAIAFGIEVAALRRAAPRFPGAP